MLARRDPFSQPFLPFLPSTRLYPARRCGPLSAGASLAALSPRAIPFLPSTLTDAPAFPFLTRRLTCRLGPGYLVEQRQQRLL
ncbi:hypothetical protein MTO96_010936 [Rhipicephalus appendiculatus]